MTRLSDRDARAYAEERGVEVASTVSTMEGTTRQTIDNAAALEAACGCRVVLTSTTGGNHATGGACTHRDGCKFDVRMRDEGIPLRTWVEQHLTPIAPRSNGDRQYRDGCGNIYAVETNVRDPHIDVEAARACPANLIKTRG